MNQYSSFIKLAGIATGVVFLGQGCPAPKQTTPAQPSPTAAQTGVRESGPVVEYVEGGFSPNELLVKPGAKVKFVNKTNSPIRVASDPHPAHDNLPGFDSQSNIGPGETYEFAFTEAGNWDYHDHLSPGVKGRIVVRQ